MDRDEEMKKITVLIMVDKFDFHGSYINGPTRNYSWLLKCLNRSRFEAHLCALRGKGRSEDIFRQENITVNYLDLGKYNPLGLIKIVRLIRQKDIDLLHLSGYGAATLGRLAGALTGTPAIVHERWADPDLGGIQQIVERFLSRFTTRGIAISEYAKDFLAEKKGLRRDKISVIPNGIPLQKFRNIDPLAGMRKRRELGIADDANVVGIVGMLHENKGHRFLIDAAALIIPNKPTTIFVIVGDGEERARLEQQVARLGLAKHILFLGHQRNIPEILRMVDIFTVTSISETGGLSLIEAMAARKAIIVSDSGGPSEIIQNGVTGFIIPVRDAQALAERIEYLIDHPSEAGRLSANAQEASSQYDINYTVQKIQQVYEDTFAAVRLRS